MFSSLAPARRRLVLGTLAVLVVALTVGIVAVVVRRRDAPGPAAPVAQQQPGPVVLVPGYGGGTGSLDVLAADLRRHGKDATVVRLPGDNTGDLDAQASALAGAIDAVRSRTGSATVDVVGYSAGGVVARQWVRTHGGAAQARRVITLGSPHHGTEIAALAGSLLPSACPTACRQLATDSTFLTRLNAGDETPSGPTWVSIWTDKDDVVMPPASASLVGALDISLQSVCPADTVRHSGLPADPNVQALVLAALGAGAPQRPTRCPTVSS